MKRVLLIGNYLPDRQMSMLAYSAMLADLLRGQGKVEVGVIAPSGVLVRPGSQPGRGSRKWRAYIDKFFFFPFRLISVAANYDVVHICDHSNAIYAYFLAGKKVVVTCHDVLAIESALGLIPGWSTRPTGKLLQRLILGGLRKVERIICVSEYTRRHLINLGIDPRKAVVALNCLNGDFFPAPTEHLLHARSLAKLPDRATYFLHVGSDQFRKNRAFVLRVFAEVLQLRASGNIFLVMVGPPLSVEGRALAEGLGITNRVLQLGTLPHKQLNALNSGAEAFIFPSRFEGFGWPIIEAQAAGCPVAIAPIPPMSEVAGGAAIFLDLDDAKASAARLLEALEHRDLLTTRGFENLARFSPQTVRDASLAAYGLGPMRDTAKHEWQA